MIKNRSCPIKVLVKKKVVGRLDSTVQAKVHLFPLGLQWTVGIKPVCLCRVQGECIQVFILFREAAKEPTGQCGEWRPNHLSRRQ